MSRQTLPDNPAVLDYVERQITEIMEAISGAQDIANHDLRADVLLVHADTLIRTLNFRKEMLILRDRLSCL